MSAADAAAGAEVADVAELAATARLLGVLLQRELDADLVARLREPAVLPHLRALGLEPPDSVDRATLDSCAAEYFELFVTPREGPPPIQSLARGGAYEGEPARAVRAIAEQLGVERRTGAARGAPPDHLGSELELWAEIAERAPAHAGEFAAAHLAWAVPLLRLRSARGGGFYARLCGVTAEFIGALSGGDAAMS